MRAIRNTVQTSFWDYEGGRDHVREQELEAMSKVLDEHPQLSEWVFEDLRAVRETKHSPRGAKGLSADQVLRVLLVKQMFGLSYKDLSFFIFDSASLRRFCRFPIDAKRPSRSGLAGVIKALRAETLEAINQVLLQAAQEMDLEDGQKVRTDCTVVETNIHHPIDSELLWDGARVLLRYLTQAHKILGPRIVFSDRSKEAKRLRMQIAFARRKTTRQAPYEALIQLVEEVVCETQSVLLVLRSIQGERRVRRALQRLIAKLESKLPLIEKVISQTRRRLLEGEIVPAREKVFSIFEEHTDIICKGSRDPEYGHKICLAAGETLILDCEILEGNPADSTLAAEMIDRQAEIYGRLPQQVSFDGSFASKENLTTIKDKEVAGTKVQDVVFSKKRGLAIEQMARSASIYQELRNFRAGIEGLISFLKRGFGLKRCVWKSWASFKSYVWSSIVSANLLLIARSRLSSA